MRLVYKENKFHDKQNFVYVYVTNQASELSLNIKNL